MPVRRPPLVHDLGLPLREEVVALLPEDPENLLLPVLEGSVFEEEEQDVADGLLGDAARAAGIFVELLLLGFEKGRRVDERLHVRLALQPARRLRGALLVLEARRDPRL